MTEQRGALVVLSGGQDSTTCLYWAAERYERIHALTFDYGQRHSRELSAAAQVVGNYNRNKDAGKADIAHEIVKVGPILSGTSPLVSHDERLEQYANWQSLPGGLEKTFVPARNALFAVLAANRAYCYGMTNIVMGVCQEDYGGYPDCREEFVSSMEQALSRGLDATLNINTPLMFLTKAETVHLAVALGVQAYTALAFTHTAYGNEMFPTGNDHATLLRQKGFEEAGVPDPAVIRAFYHGFMREWLSREPYASHAGMIRNGLQAGISLWQLLARMHANLPR